MNRVPMREIVRFPATPRLPSRTIQTALPETTQVPCIKGFCYIELGAELALRGDGSFFDTPHPTMTPKEPDAAQLEEKKAWVADWLARYLR